MNDSRPALAVDIGGTKLAAGLVEPAGRVLSWSQVPTPSGLDAEQLWRTLDALITGVMNAADITPAGLGLRRPDGVAGRVGVTAEHSWLARLPPPQQAG